jgi:hypothetical protein
MIGRSRKLPNKDTLALSIWGTMQPIWLVERTRKLAFLNSSFT